MSNDCRISSIRENEIDVRPNKITDKSVQLLLYQDARRVQNVLDSTYGPLNWQREYYEANSMLFCKIGIKNSETGEWIWKSDTGSSGGVEEEKSLASDAFKRAAVSWGIGRELYSVSNIYVDLNEKDFYNNEFKQTFKVKEISIEDGIIMTLIIVDKYGKIRFNYSRDTPLAGSDTKPKTREDELTAFCSKKKREQGVDIKQLKKFYNYFMAPSANNPKIKVIDSWNNPIPEKMWDWWMSKNDKAA